jgi:hypothetical protein
LRVVELEVGGERLELHPAVTVVRGLSQRDRAGVVAALSRLPAGDTADASGRLEVHGVLLDLDPSVLAMLDLHADLDAAIRPSDLPGPVAANLAAVRIGTEDRTLDEAAGRAREGWAAAARTRWRHVLGNDSADARSDLAARHRRRLVVVLERLLGTEPTSAALAVEAARLADELVVLDARPAEDRLWRRDDTAPVADAAGVARSRLAHCLDEVAHGEERALLTPLTAEQVLELERSHTRVRHAQERARHRLGGRRAHRQLTHALDEEAELLRGWSVAGWSEPAVLPTVEGVPGGDHDAVEDATHRLARAEEQLSAMTSSTELRIDDARRTIRHHATLAEARSLLGGIPDADLPDALRQLARKGPTAGDVELLRAELRSAGLVLGDEPVPDSETIELAIALLEELRGAAGDVDNPGPADYGLAETDAEVLAAEAAAAAAVGAAAQAGSPPAWPGLGSAEVGDLETVVLARLDAHRRVGLAGAIPVVLDDALGDLATEEVERVLDALESASLLVQVVVVSDDPAIAAWAERVGPGRAGVVTGGLR